ncbi:hypothetical protein [Paenarthrobacter ilicis]|uniref:hypothetical protein n=1 Tax=Paenarthrobacter ilicis TaxID=43665 RepID=UPI0028D02078|nr:hypothetical protein [Paenarthrobacter ilicis]
MTGAFEMDFTVRQGGRKAGTFAEWQAAFEALGLSPDVALLAGTEDETAPWQITIRWRIEPDTGTATPAAVSAEWRPVDGAPVSAEGWRTANIGAAIRETRHRLQYWLHRMGTDAADASPFEAAATALQEPRKAGRPAHYGPEHYATVARIYNAAMRGGERNPVRIVAERMAAELGDPGLTDGSDKRAKYWVRMARQQGLLEGTPERGRPKNDNK